MVLFIAVHKIEICRFNVVISCLLATLLKFPNECLENIESGKLLQGNFIPFEEVLVMRLQTSHILALCAIVLTCFFTMY